MTKKPEQFDKLTIRIPADVKDWLAAQTARNASSYASEIARALRERMERVDEDRTKVRSECN